jgi:hypothetical protein
MALTPFVSTAFDSRATTVVQMTQERQVATFRNKIQRNPPPASRHRAVMELPTPIPLFDMQRSSQNPLDITNFFQETRESVPFMMVKTITTDIHRKLQHPPDFVEVLIQFYAKIEATDNTQTSVEYYFIMPQTWAPKMYLGALHLSINRHPVISIENYRIQGVNYLTLNEVHWLFSEAAGPAERIRHWLQGAAAFIYISGGTMKGSTW